MTRILKATFILTLGAAVVFGFAGCKEKSDVPTEGAKPEEKEPGVPQENESGAPQEKRPKTARPAESEPRPGPAATRAGGPAGTAVAATAAIPPLVSVDWLKKHEKDKNLVVLDGVPKKYYDAGHIPGARHAPCKKLFNENRGKVLLETVTDRGKVQNALQQLGVNKDSHIVVTWEGKTKKELFYAAKTHFCLHGFGVRASILDGGTKAWKKAGNPVTGEIPRHGKGNITLSQEFDKNLIATMEDVKKSNALFDVRPPVLFKGEKKMFADRAGTIPKSVNLPFAMLLAGDGTFKKPDEIKKIFAKYKVTDGALVYCAVGGAASIAWFAATQLAGTKVRLYDGSMNEWAAVKENPVVKGKVAEAKAK